MTACGFNEPLLVVSDKNRALRRAVRETLPHAFNQPCQAHKMRNILSKLPKRAQREMNPMVRQVFYTESYEQGLRQERELIARFKDDYTSAMDCR